MTATQEPQKPDIYNQILQLVADERKTMGKPQIMKGRLLSRLINAVDAVLKYEPKEEKKP